MAQRLLAAFALGQSLLGEFGRRPETRAQEGRSGGEDCSTLLISPALQLTNRLPHRSAVQTTGQAGTRVKLVEKARFGIDDRRSPRSRTPSSSVLKRRAKDEFEGRHFEATLILQAISWYLRYLILPLLEVALCGSLADHALRGGSVGAGDRAWRGRTRNL